MLFGKSNSALYRSLGWNLLSKSFNPLIPKLVGLSFVRPPPDGPPNLKRIHGHG